jgi:hypothetical protein
MIMVIHCETQSFFPTLRTDKIVLLNAYTGHTIVAHNPNPSYLDGRKQEDYGMRPTQAKS